MSDGASRTPKRKRPSQGGEEHDSSDDVVMSHAVIVANRSVAGVSDSAHVRDAGDHNDADDDASKGRKRTKVETKVVKGSSSASAGKDRKKPSPKRTQQGRTHGPGKAFTREEDLALIDWFHARRDNRALIDLLGGQRHANSVAARVEILFRKWRSSV